ncbi:MAG TPA: hypothetical protein VII43_03760 [Opitutaceae bacterium]
MANHVPQQEGTGRLERQRNLFVAVAAFALAAVALPMAHRAASHRELKGLNGRIFELQLAIVDTRNRIRVVEARILDAQREATKEATR